VTPFGVQRYLAAAIAFSSLACRAPDDIVFTPPVVEPVEESGRLRVTFNPGPDLVRGFSADGRRILYRSRGLAGFGDEWRILSVPVAGGEVREEAALYRAGLSDPVSTLASDPGGRTLVVWKAIGPPFMGCGSPAPTGPTVETLVILRLDEVDGRALSALPITLIPTPTILGGGTPNQQVRILPAELEIRALGVDPFGPAADPGGAGVGFVSDGELVWRVQLTDPAASLDSIGEGAFPALSSDGTQLAAATPSGTVTTFDTTVVAAGLGVCVQETVTIRPAAWQVVLYDLGSGTATAIGEGVEPRFDPAGGRLLVRRSEGLYWLDLTSGAASFVSGTEGGYSAAISPDGSTIAFSAMGSEGHDVFLVAAR
jgi:hypothetical protein